MAQFGSQLKFLPSREVQESLLNCIEEGTKMVTSLVDGSLSEGQFRSFYNPSTRSKLKSFEDMTHRRETIMLESDQLEKTEPFQQ
jgi:hypothetical protein